MFDEVMIFMEQYAPTILQASEYNNLGIWQQRLTKIISLLEKNW